jgi:hypothetical protein
MDPGLRREDEGVRRRIRGSVIAKLAIRPTFSPPFKVRGHSIEAISELEQFLADL